MPSRLESFGLVVLEALANHCPVIASPVGGIPEIASRFPERAVRLADFGDPDAFAERLTQAVSSGPPDWRAVDSVLAAEFSPEAFASRYLRIFRRIAEKRFCACVRPRWAAVLATDP